MGGGGGGGGVWAGIEIGGGGGGVVLADFLTRIFFLYSELHKCLEKKNAKTQVLFKVYGQFSSAFQDNFEFQGFFKSFIFKYFSSLWEPRFCKL